MDGGCKRGLTDCLQDSIKSASHCLQTVRIRDEIVVDLSNAINSHISFAEQQGLILSDSQM